MKKVIIIIVSFNQSSELKKCVSSLNKMQFSSNLKPEILLINNGQKTQTRLLTKIPLKIIHHNKNLGFAKAINRGIKEGIKNKGQYFLIINPDTIISPGLLKSLSSFLINDEKLGIIAPIIKFKRDKKTVYDYGGNLNWWLGRPKHQEKTQFFKHKLIFPEYVSGCCMLIKKEVFDKIGFFDEKFFLYFEDVDFCLRAQKAGFKLVINPQAVILHNLNEQKLV